MAEIVDLADRREAGAERDPAGLIWQCECGCRSFYARGDGLLQCCGCEALVIAEDGAWTVPAVDEVADGAAAEAEAFTVKLGQPEALHWRRFAERVLAGEFVMLIGLMPDGRVATMTDDAAMATTVERRAWLRRRLREAYRLLTGSGL